MLRLQCSGHTWLSRLYTAGQIRAPPPPLHLGMSDVAPSLKPAACGECHVTLVLLGFLLTDVRCVCRVKQLQDQLQCVSVSLVFIMLVISCFIY